MERYNDLAQKTDMLQALLINYLERLPKEMQDDGIYDLLEQIKNKTFQVASLYYFTLKGSILHTDELIRHTFLIVAMQCRVVVLN